MISANPPFLEQLAPEYKNIKLRELLSYSNIMKYKMKLILRMNMHVNILDSYSLGLQTLTTAFMFILLLYILYIKTSFL